MNHLREMQPEDIRPVFEVIESQDEEDAEEALAGYQEIGGTMDNYVMVVNNRVIGVTGYATPLGCDETHWLAWTYIHDDYANQGNGRIMLTELIQYLKDKGGRMLFVKVSDYVDEEDGAIYAAALHLYKSLGFKEQLVHKNYYDEDESQTILALRLKDSETSTEVETEDCPVEFNAVFEIAETDGAYSFGWHDEADSVFTPEDVSIGIQQARKDNARAVFLSFPQNYSKVRETLIASGFTQSGMLTDYFEDGVHEEHFTYVL
ncbi:MAG: ribosomal protein S18 acetylase RimI-like enzyme [Cocleimonas sp.]|jgi:ribosomal protein S18 acetylase RimI-like enzyme